jgi:hypothetical protein
VIADERQNVGAAFIDVGPDPDAREDRDVPSALTGRPAGEGARYGPLSSASRTIRWAVTASSVTGELTRTTPAGTGLTSVGHQVLLGH